VRFGAAGLIRAYPSPRVSTASVDVSSYDKSPLSTLMADVLRADEDSKKRTRYGSCELAARVSSSYSRRELCDASLVYLPDPPCCVLSPSPSLSLVFIAIRLPR